jgi:hypothetical protein
MTESVGTSLAPAAAADKATIENWIGDPTSPYHRGDDHMTALEIQTHYRDLVRGELAGAAGSLDPGEAADRDVPAKVSGYELAGLPIYNALDRDVVDSFLAAALAAHLGVARVRDAIRWAMTQAPPTEAAFRRWGWARGWSDRQMKACIGWFKAEAARQRG